MLIKSLLIGSFAFLPLLIFSQNISINNDGSLPHPNAMLDIRGVNKGLLIPRGDIITRSNLASNTAKGLMMYDTLTNSIWVHNGNALFNGWNPVASGTNYWQLSGALGTEIKNTNTGGFWSANTSTLLVDPGVISTPVFGSGTRLMWIPQKSAFRVGTVTGVEWADGNIGTWSFASGYNSIANGNYSTAIGNTQLASGLNAMALGNFSEAIGDYSLTLGYDAQTLSQYSIAIGKSCRAVNFTTTAIGDGSVAYAFNSMAIGHNNSATGDYSSSLGTGLVSKAYNSIAIGRYNDSISTSSNTLDLSTNPILYVGNGNNSTNRSNAMVIYKNGNMDINGNVDISGNTNMAGTATVTGNTDIGGFTQLGTGSPSIKMKKLVTTSPAAQGGFTLIAHGLTQSKILSITALITVPGGFQIIPNHIQAGFQYTLNVDNANIAVGAVNGNSGNILSMPVKILIVYEE